MVNLSLFRVSEIQRGLLLSMISATLLWYYMEQNNRFDIIYNNYWNYVSLSATLLGFAITAFTIFFAFPTNYKIDLLTRNENYHLLFDAFLLVIYLLILFLLSSLLGVFINVSGSHFIYFLFIFILIWSLVSVFLMVWILKKVIDISLSSRQI
jgi:hypothetical protein